MTTNRKLQEVRDLIDSIESDYDDMKTDFERANDLYEGAQETITDLQNQLEEANDTIRELENLKDQ